MMTFWEMVWPVHVKPSHPIPRLASPDKLSLTGQVGGILAH